MRTKNIFATIAFFSLVITIQAQNIPLESGNYIFLHDSSDTNWRFGKDNNHNINIYGAGLGDRRFRIVKKNQSAETELFNVNLESGNVGIGTTSPGTKLDIQSGSLRIYNSDATGTIEFKRTSDSWNAATIHQAYPGAYGGDLYFKLHPSDGNLLTQPETKVVFKSSGNVGIGTIDPQSKLAVNGQIRAIEVKVLANINVPDYVFESDYQLRTLQETKEYIQENKHLPEIPSAAEINANGIALGDMNMRLLKKIEELTLYQIELMERLELVEATNKKMEKKLQKLIK